MNNWTGSGFISRDIEEKYIKTKSGEEMKMARFSVACQRKGKDAGADFIGCVAYGKNAEGITKWFSKGKGIEIRGHIQTGSYDGKNGKVYTTEIVVDEWGFPSVRKAEEQSANNDASETVQEQANEPQSAPSSEFINIPEGIENDLPFR